MDFIYDNDDFEDEFNEFEDEMYFSEYQWIDYLSKSNNLPNKFLYKLLSLKDLQDTESIIELYEEMGWDFEDLNSSHCFLEDFDEPYSYQSRASYIVTYAIFNYITKILKKISKQNNESEYLLLLVNIQSIFTNILTRVATYDINDPELNRIFYKQTNLEINSIMFQLQSNIKNKPLLSYLLNLIHFYRQFNLHLLQSEAL